MLITGLGFFIKPRLYVLEDGIEIADGVKLFEKKTKNIDISYMSDGFFAIKLNDNTMLDICDESEIMLDKFNKSLIHSNYAKIVYFLFMCIFNKKNELHLDLYDICGDESINVMQYDEIWKKGGMTRNGSGHLSFNFLCLMSPYCGQPEYKISIEKKLLLEYFEEFSKILDNILADDNLLQTLLLFVNAMQNMKNCHFDTSVVLFWTSIEKIIDEVWEKMIDTSNYNSELKNKIKKSIEYTVSVKINELFLNGKLDFDLVKELENARKIRNKIIHGQYNLFFTEGTINGTFQNVFEKCNILNKAALHLIENVYNLNLDIEFMLNTQSY